MFPNGFNAPFYPPYSGMPRMATGISAIPRSGGLFSRLGAGASGIKSINWQGLLSNTSRTLGVINQAIPIVKQVGPVYNNMKSMLKLASLFKDETDPAPKKNNNSNISNDNGNNNNNSNIITNNTKIINDEKENTTINNYSNIPNFFI